MTNMLEGGANPVIEGSAVGGTARQWIVATRSLSGRSVVSRVLLPSNNVPCRSVGHNLCEANTHPRVVQKVRELRVLALQR